MKFSIARDELLKGLSAVQSVVEKRNTMPILANVLLQATKDGQLRITATDLEVGLTTLYPAKVTGAGEITLNARNLVEITRQLPSADIHLQLLANAQVEISCGKSIFKLHGLPAGDFPAFPEVHEREKLVFPGSVFAEMIDHTIFSVSTDETRYNLSGVFLESSEDGALRMVSSDGHRLSLVEKRGEGRSVNLKESVIIPRKGLLEIRKLASEAGDKDLEIFISKANCLISLGNSKLVIRLIDGEFPDYRQVLPREEGQKKVVLPRQEFLSALKRISVLSQEKTRGVRFQFERSSLKINVTNPDLGEAEEEMEIKYDHPPLEIGFNARYFMDILELIDTPQVDLFLTDSMSQGLIQPEGDASFRAVVMPMKLL